MDKYKPVFKKKEYNSNNGFSTHIWGKIFWFQLHLVSFNYPVKPTKQKKKDFYNYIELLKRSIIPCKICRDNLSKNLKDCGWGMNKLKNRETFSKFIYDLHNKVNIMTGKGKSKESYEEIRDLYENFRARTSKLKGGKKENGCDHEVHGIKSKCLIKIVPRISQQKSFSIHSKCKKKP